jgi:hypothetical protein
MENVRNSTALLADLIVHGKPARIAFKSEEQFLDLLGGRVSESPCAGERNPRKPGPWTLRRGPAYS